MSFRLKYALACFGVWNIWHFVWLVCIFYMTFSLPEQRADLVIPALILWTLFGALYLAVLFWRTNRIEKTLSALARNPQPDDATLAAAARSAFNLPWHGALIFLSFFLLMCASAALVWRLGGLGWLAIHTTWIPTIAGTCALTASVYALSGFFAGTPANILTSELQKRGLEPEGHRTGIRTKMVVSFMLYATAYGSWMGGMGYYNGVDQTRQEIQRGQIAQLQLLKSMLPATPEVEPTAPQLKERLRGTSLGPHSSMFIVERDGTLYGNEVEVYPQVDVIENRLRREFAAGQTGGIYDNSRAQVIAYHPFDDRFLLGSITPLTGRLNSLTYLVWLGIFMSAGYLTVFIISFFMSGGIRHAALSMNRIVKTIRSKGERIDLSVRGGVESMDEMGRLALNINKFTARLTSMLAEIKSVAEAIDQSSEKIKHTADDISRGARDQAATVEESAAAMEEMTVTARQVSERAELQAKQAGKVKVSLEKLDRTISAVAERADSVKSSAARSLAEADQAEIASQESIDGITVIEESAEDILRIVQVIADIADRTNLLSLNASIEAARAGEMGRGFAVVASEISTLADQSSKSSSEIEKLVQNARQGIADGAAKVRRLGDFITRIRASVDEAGSSGGAVETAALNQRSLSDEILSMVNELDTLSQQVSLAESEQSRTANEMNDGLEQINQATQRAVTDVEGIVQALGPLAEQIEKLNAFLENFKIDANK